MIHIHVLTVASLAAFICIILLVLEVSKLERRLKQQERNLASARVVITARCLPQGATLHDHGARILYGEES